MGRASLDVTNLEAVKILRYAGIRRRWPSHFSTGRMHYVWIVVVILVVILVVAIAVQFVLPFLESLKWFRYRFDLTGESVTPVVMIIAAILGAKEWNSTKAEEALDKFYDRLNLTNEKLRTWKNARLFISEDWCQKETFEKEMYACMEVDNLEYAIQKYERGYLEPRDAYRAVTCFTSRCQDGSFKETVRKVAARGGYRDNTMIALSKMCSVCRGDCQHRDAPPAVKGALPGFPPRYYSSSSHGSQ